jgi:hypothetical protein
MSTTTRGPAQHPVLAALEVARDELGRIGEGNLWSLTDAESLDVRIQLEQLSAMVAAARIAATRDVDSRAAAVAAGATSTTAWLVNRLRVHPGAAAREVRLAEALDRELPATRAALAAGEIGTAAVEVIAETDTALRACATAAERAQAEALLVDHASRLPVRGLQAAALHLRHRLDPDRGHRLEREEQRQLARREFRLRIQPDGTSRPDGYLDVEATALLRTALDSLSAPRPSADGARDLRTPGQRRGDALVELVELAVRSGNLPTRAGQPVQLTVTIGLTDLQQGLTQAACRGAGWFDDGQPVSAATIRRLACDAQVIPVLLGSASQPLDVGHAVRSATLPIHRALAVRDQGCAFPGCDRPPAWSVVHHICHWADGGDTSCANCVLLCGRHHRVVHHDGWDVAIEADGLPSFYPPAWIDPERSPRRNHRLRPHAAMPGADPNAADDDVLADVLPFTRT